MKSFQVIISIYLSLLPLYGSEEFCALTLERLQKAGRIFVSTHQVMRPDTDNVRPPRLDIWTQMKADRLPGVPVLLLEGTGFPTPRGLQKLKVVRKVQSESGAIPFSLAARQIFISGGRLDRGLQETFNSIFKSEYELPADGARSPLTIVVLAAATGVDPQKFKGHLNLASFFESLRTIDEEVEEVGKLVHDLLRPISTDVIAGVGPLPRLNTASEFGCPWKIDFKNGRSITLQIEH